MGGRVRGELGPLETRRVPQRRLAVASFLVRLPFGASGHFPSPDLLLGISVAPSRSSMVTSPTGTRPRSGSPRIYFPRRAADRSSTRKSRSARKTTSDAIVAS